MKKRKQNMNHFDLGQVHWQINSSLFEEISFALNNGGFHVVYFLWDALAD